MTDLDAMLRNLAPDKLQDTARRIVALAEPHLDRNGRTLIYVLAQTFRIGHFGLESQIIRTLYEDSYDRIVIVGGGGERDSGTNPWIPHCLGPKFRYVYAGDFDVKVFGMLDGGLQARPAFDLLLAHPRSLFIAFYRHILGGGRVKYLELGEEVEARARTTLVSNGIDPDEPFVFFHNRTLDYRPGSTYHEHRTSEIGTYRASIERLIEAGYRVIRIGEPGLDTMGLDPARYVSLPDWPAHDRAADLYVCARCAFGLAQNSGPIWVVAGFGRSVLRTNLPFEVLNLPYTDDLSLFRHYRRIGSTEPLGYRRIIEARLPTFRAAEQIAAAGYETVPNTSEELLAATDEMLDRVAGRWRRDDARQERFRALGEPLDAWLRSDPEFSSHNLAFYGYAYPYGAICQSFLDANPRFLD